MSEMSHTPAPWKVGPTGDTVDDANGLELLRMYESDGREEPTALPYRANAAFIVRACNSHEELLVALKWAERQLRALVTEDDGAGAFIRGSGMELAGFGAGVCAMQAAIANAEGR